MTPPPIADHLKAAADLLAQADQLAAEAAAAADAGHLNLALGTAVPIELLLRDALALYAAAVVLNRRRPARDVP